MKKIPTKFKGLILIENFKFNDNRGYFREIYKMKLVKKINLKFWCMSKSKKNVLRGMHLQLKNPQDKYISVVKGKIFDVVLDLRSNSSTFGKYYKVELSEKNCRSLFIPSGFAHGFYGLDRENTVFYGCSNYRSKNSEIGILWDDKDLKIKWPKGKKIISKKDNQNMSFAYFKKKIRSK
jgi:dTDP-4-dehydrorhamnose 3,5-epimerase